MASHSSENYLKYWKNRVDVAVDGTKVSNISIQNDYIELLDIRVGEKVLDLGCSYGRLCSVLKRKTDNVFGLDIDYCVIEQALKEPYVITIKGQAEEMPFPSEFFDKVIAWGVYDMVEQKKALCEANRILKKGGQLLFTGKNTSYSKNDRLAFIAERNAKLNNFPNHFTDLNLLFYQIEAFGFQVSQAFGFAKRGDFGENKNIDIIIKQPNAFYEYLVILEKHSNDLDAKDINEFVFHESYVAKSAAIDAGHSNVIEYFKAHKKNFP